MNNKTIFKTTLILGATAAIATAIASTLSNKDNKAKVKQAATEFKDKTAEVIKDLERDYKEFDTRLGKFSKTRDYKRKVEEINKATKTILQQLQIIKGHSSGILSEVGTQARKSFTK